MSLPCHTTYPPPSDETIATMLKALGHPVRFMMVKRLLEKSRSCCGDLCDCFDQSQSTVSQHLAVLRDAGILGSHRDGNRMIYFVESDALNLLSEVISGLSGNTAEGAGK